MPWTPNRWNQHTDTTPAFLRLGRAVVEDIREGRLSPGDRLPSSRALANDLGVHRNTVIAAYDELVAQGWIEALHGRGTFVSRDLPQKITHPTKEHVPPNFRMGMRAPLIRNAPEPDVLSMAGGLPDTRLVSCTELSRTIRRVLRRGRTLLDYGSPYGAPRLRTAITQMLRETRGMDVAEDQVLITRGSQMGIYLLGQSLVQRGDVVAVESTGYRAAFDALRMAGARLAPVPVDEHGLQVDKLEELHARRKLRAVYLTPHHQFPTLVTLSASRRIRLQAFARKHRIAIIEDDYDHEFHYEGRPVLPMASDNSSGNVVYVGTLSKVLAPGLRIGYVVAPPSLITSLAAIRSHIDSHGDAVMETAIAEWIEEGELERHARRVRKAYLARRETLVSLLETHLGDSLSFDIPTGGMALWVRALCCDDVDAWAARTLAGGVRVSPASLYRIDRRNSPHMRIGFAKLNEEELGRAVRVLAEAQPG